MPKPKSKESLKEIYTLIVETLKAVMPNVEEKLGYYRNLDCKDWSDRDFFEVLTRSVFTGIREDIIERKWSAIKTAFSDFDFTKVAKFSAEELMNKPDIIQHQGRIRATVNNAKKMRETVSKYGSFLDYINSFKKPDDLIANLQEEFEFIGEVNVFEFLKELGLPFIKPDRQVRKVFLRLGLIGEKASPEEVDGIGKVMAKTVKEKPAVVDCAVWHFGREICKAKPDCERCSLIKFCNFQH